MNRAGGERQILLLLSVCFLLGGIAGCLLEETFPADAVTDHFLAVAVQGYHTPSLWREIVSLLKWPVLAIILAHVPLTGVTIPALFALRGTILSYGISAFVVGNGLEGGLASGALFGPICLLSLPLFFLLGAEALMRQIGAEAPPRKKWIAAAGLCALLLLFCCMIDRHVTPVFLSALLMTVTVS